MIAQSDTDALVRKAAVEKVTDLTLLNEIADTDPDMDVQELASKMVIDKKCEKVMLSQEEIVKVLWHEGAKWYEKYNLKFDDKKSRRPHFRRIRTYGWELYRRGGLQLMQLVYQRMAEEEVRAGHARGDHDPFKASYAVDMCWDKIGEWQFSVYRYATVHRLFG